MQVVPAQKPKWAKGALIALAIITAITAILLIWAPWENDEKKDTRKAATAETSELPGWQMVALAPHERLSRKIPPNQRVVWTDPTACVTFSFYHEGKKKGKRPDCPGDDYFHGLNKLGQVDSMTVEAGDEPASFSYRTH